jgi:hypothetical protein
LLQRSTCFKQIGDRRKEALTLWAIGEVHAYDGRFTESVASYQVALAVFQDIK